MVRAERFELPTFWFVARRSIQLSYARMRTQIRLPNGVKNAKFPGRSSPVLRPRVSMARPPLPTGQEQIEIGSRRAQQDGVGHQKMIFPAN